MGSIVGPHATNPGRQRAKPLILEAVSRRPDRQAGSRPTEPFYLAGRPFETSCLRTKSWWRQ